MIQGGYEPEYRHARYRELLVWLLLRPHMPLPSPSTRKMFQLLKKRILVGAMFARWLDPVRWLAMVLEWWQREPSIVGAAFARHRGSPVALVQDPRRV